MQGRGTSSPVDKQIRGGFQRGTRCRRDWLSAKTHHESSKSLPNRLKKNSAGGGLKGNRGSDEMTSTTTASEASLERLAI